MKSRKEMKKKAHSYDRKKFRKNVINGLRTIEKTIKLMAKKGETSYNITIKENNGWLFINLLAVRLFKKKNPDFDTNITYDYIDDNISDFSFYGAYRIYIKISWD
jgi:hypothetical protein